MLGGRRGTDGRLRRGAASIIIAAVWLTWDGQGPAIDAGAILIVAACVAWSVDNNLTRNAFGADPTTIAPTKGLGCRCRQRCLSGVERRPPSHIVRRGSRAARVGSLGIGVSLVRLSGRFATLGSPGPARIIRWLRSSALTVRLVFAPVWWSQFSRPPSRCFSSSSSRAAMINVGVVGKPKASSAAAN